MFLVYNSPMLNGSKLFKLLIWLMAGLCLALPFVSIVFYWLVLPGIALSIYLIINAKNYTEVFWGSWFLGTVKSLGGYSFIWASYPIVGITIKSNLIQIIGVGFYWLSTSVAMGLGIVFLGWSFYWFNKKKPKLSFFLFPTLWVVAEIISSFFTSIIFFGPGSYLNIYIDHGYVGLTMAHLAILYPFAWFAGVYGLTFIVSLMGTLTYVIAFRSHWSRVVATKALVILIIILYLLYLITPKQNLSESKDIKVIAIDTRFPSELLNDEKSRELKAEETVKATLQAATYHPDIILLPEDSRLTEVFGSAADTLNFLRKNIEPDFAPLIVDSARTETDGKTILRAYYYDIKNNEIYTVDKQYLVAEGEYVSYLFRGIIRILGQQEAMETAYENMNYEPGPIDNYSKFPDNVPPIIFCFESSSALAIKLIDGKDRLGDIVLHPFSHSRFHSPDIFWYQLKTMLRTQAIWNNKIIVSAGNMANGSIYYSDGHVGVGVTRLQTPLWSIVEYNF